MAGYSLLHYAAQQGTSRSLINRLLLSGACVSLRDFYEGQTALQILEEKCVTCSRPSNLSCSRSLSSDLIPHRLPPLPAVSVLFVLFEIVRGGPVPSCSVTG